MVVMAGLVAVGHGLRCVSQEEDTFTMWVQDFSSAGVIP